MLVGDGMFVRVQLDLSVRVHEIALVKAGMMHVKKKKNNPKAQSLLVIAIFSHKCLCTSTPVISPILISPEPSLLAAGSCACHHREDCKGTT